MRPLRVFFMGLLSSSLLLLLLATRGFAAPAFDPPVPYPAGIGSYYDVLSERSWLESKVSEGGTASVRLREQLAHARAELDGQPG